MFFVGENRPRNKSYIPPRHIYYASLRSSTCRPHRQARGRPPLQARTADNSSRIRSRQTGEGQNTYPCAYTSFIEHKKGRTHVMSGPQELMGQLTTRSRATPLYFTLQRGLLGPLQLAPGELQRRLGLRQGALHHLGQLLDADGLGRLDPRL
jgi:hypothetical protein